MLKLVLTFVFTATIFLDYAKTGYLLIKIEGSKDSPYAPITESPGQLKTTLEKNHSKYFQSLLIRIGVCSLFKFIDI